MEATSTMHPDTNEQILVASRFHHGNKRGWNLHRYYASILYPKDFFPSHPSFKPFPQNKIHQSFTLPLSFNHRRVPSASSCGLVYFYDYLATLVVCNPATGQSRPLPSLWVPEQVLHGSGFGYDPTSDDYKVVRVYTSYDSDIDDIRAHVHALKSDCWKEIKMMPELPRFDIDNVGGVYVSGSCYWIVALQFRNPFNILSFDFATETFSTLPLPQPLPPDHGYRLVELDGRLGAILYKRFDRTDARKHTNVFEVWVLEQGSSWMMCFRVPIDNAMVPLALRHDVLFFEGKSGFDNRVNQLFVYDLVTEKVEALDVFDRPESMKVIPYVETTYVIPNEKVY